MASRLLRDWTLSPKVNSLTPLAERFFTRLIMKVDDYGCFMADSRVLKNTLFVTRDDVRDADISRWVDECHKAGLILVYSVEDKAYLQILDFGQRLRTKKSKYPLPTSVSDVRTSVSNPPPEVEEEVEVEVEEEVELENELRVWPTFEDFWMAYGKKVEKPKTEAKWKKISQAAREKIMDHVPRYVASTPDVAYRKNPLTYLNNESWNDEIITKPTNAKGNGDYLKSLAVAATR